MKFLIPVFVIIVSLSIWWTITLEKDNASHYSGTIETDDVQVGSKVGGRVMKLNVQEGDEVHTGDLLVQLDDEKQKAQLLQAHAELETANQHLQELQHGSRPQEIKKAKANLDEAKTNLLMLLNGPRKEDIQAAQQAVEAAKAELELAALTKKRTSQLLSKQNTSQEAMDRALTNYDVAQSHLKAAQAQLNQLLAGFREEEIDMARARVEAASEQYSLILEGPRVEQIKQAKAAYEKGQAAVEQATIDLKETKILAPSDAVVETARLRPGDLLSPQETALTLVLYEPLWVRIYVPESQLGRVKLQQIIPLSVKAYPSKQFTGHVVQINRQAEFTPRNVQTPETRDDLVFGIKIEIKDPSRMLRPGMVADFYLTPSEKAKEN